MKDVMVSSRNFYTLYNPPKIDSYDFTGVKSVVDEDEHVETKTLVARLIKGQISVSGFAARSDQFDDGSDDPNADPSDFYDPTRDPAFDFTSLGQSMESVAEAVEARLSEREALPNPPANPQNSEPGGEGQASSSAQSDPAKA